VAIQPLRLDQVQVPYRKGMIYSGPGHGKTITACSSLTKPTILLDVDNGYDAVYSHRLRHGLRMDNVIPLPITSMKDHAEAWSWINKNISWIAGGIVVLDSATELQRLDMREHISGNKKKYSDQRDWGMVLTDFEDLFADIRHLPFNMVITAHEFNRADVDKGRAQWRPSFQGRFAYEYAKHLSFIGRLQIGYQEFVGANGMPQYQVVRAINFGPDPDIHCKDRSGMLGLYEPPDIDTILWKMSQFNVAQPQQF